MKITPEQLVSKAGATVEALKAMAPEDLEPTDHFARDFNNFRKFSIAIRPDLAEIAPIAAGSSRNARYV